MQNTRQEINWCGNVHTGFLWTLSVTQGQHLGTHQTEMQTSSRHMGCFQQHNLHYKPSHTILTHLLLPGPSPYPPPPPPGPACCS
jgi:hypothetical protein